MQIIYIEKQWMILLCFILWPIIQVSAALLCMKIPRKYLNYTSRLFREHKWEMNGTLYVKIFHIKKWKHLLPDGGAVVKDGYKKKNLMDYSIHNLDLFIVESCRAELSHILAILPFWIFGLFIPADSIIYMFLYALIVNLPCIIAQRYNRPRIIKVMQNQKRKSKLNSKLKD